jgi:Tol biopolymer transport system component/uncharacterized membrane protein
MDDNSQNRPRASLEINLEATEYSVTAGSSVDVLVVLSNPGSSGDYFKVSLLGISPGWIAYTGQPAVWLPAGGEEKVTFTITPPADLPDVAGTYLARLIVSSQSASDLRKEQELQLKVLPPEKPKGPIGLRLESDEIKAIPGSEIKIPVAIANRTQETDTYDVSVQGVPSSWVVLSTPVVTVPGGLEKKIEVILHLPPPPAVQVGHFPIKISISSQNNPQNKYEAQLKLTVAAFESTGRVGVIMSSIQFSVVPGESMTIPITLENRGLQPDSFRLGVEGIPATWVSTAAPVVSLAPGEKKEVNLAIRPSLTSSTQVGRNKLVITITSLAAPGEIVRVDCILTVAVISQFSVDLDPKQAKAGQLFRVMVKNQGNTQQVFQLSCKSPSDQLVFDYQLPENYPMAGPTTYGQVAPPTTAAGMHPGEPTLVTIPAGESAAFRFSAHPQQRQIVGGEAPYPFTVLVKSQQKQSPTLQGQVLSRGMIPIWVIPLVLFLCIVIFGTAIVLGKVSGNKAGSATQSYLTATALGTSLSETSAAETDQAFISTQAFLTEIAQAVSSTQTAAAYTAVAGAATQTVIAGTDQATGATQTSAFQTLQAVAATETMAALQTSIATQATLTPTPTQQPSQTPTTEVTPTPTQVSLPRFGGVILFTSERDGNPEIYNMDDAGHISRLTNNPAVDMQAVWSPNMQQVAFTTNRDGQNEIYLMNADGSNQVNLTNNPADDQYPTWSIDGQSIAFSTNRDGNYEIYMLNVSSQAVQNLSNNPATDTQPDWVKSTTTDPSGESIVFTTNRDGNPEIYRMKTDGTEPVNLSQNPANDTMAKGSPDGALVVFTTDRDGNQEVYSMTNNGNGATNLTNNPANDFGPCWAPNQAWVGFTTDRDGNREVYILKPNTGEVYNLTRNPSSDTITDWR